VALKYFILWTCNRLLIVSHDNFKSFFSNIACRFAVIVEYCSRTLVESVCSQISSLSSWSHDSVDHPRFRQPNTVLSTYLRMPHFFMYSAATSRVIFGPFGGVQSNTASNRDAYAALIVKYVVLPPRSNVNCDFL
jgi:hypothetical protein